MMRMCVIICEDKNKGKEQAVTHYNSRRMWKDVCVCERDDAGPKFTLSPKQKLFAGELGPGHIWCGGAPLQLTLPSLLAAAGAAANSRFTSSSSPLTSRQSSHTCPLRRAAAEAAGKPTTQTGTPSFSSPSPLPLLLLLPLSLPSLSPLSLSFSL